MLSNLGCNMAVTIAVAFAAVSLAAMYVRVVVVEVACLVIIDTIILAIHRKTWSKFVKG